MGSKKSSNKGLIIYVLVLVAAMIVIVTLMRQATKTVSEYSYSDIMSYFDNYQVSDYKFDLGTGALDMMVTQPDGTQKNIVYNVPNVSVFLAEIQTGQENYRKEYNSRHPEAPLAVEYYKIQDTSWLYSLLPSILIIILMVALFFFMIRQTGAGGKINSFSKANVRNNAGKKNTFADVAGADEEKEELKEIVDFLKNPKKYSEMGARIPKGVLLMGPPGTGKTLLAKAVAGEAGVPFFSISGSDFVELYVGVGASRVRDLFETAKKNSPSIVFIDEIDAVGRQRGAGLGGGHDEREQTLNQLLVEMDGFEGNEGVIVIAATNRRDILDPALLRPGRFDREVMVGYPDVKGREEILKVHAKNKPLSPDVDLNVIAKTTQFFTGADLENLLNEAALLAARQNKKAITEENIEEATLKVIAGPEKKSHIVTDRDKRITAFHEAGHAVAAYYLPECEKVHQVTTIQRGQAAGMTVCRPETDDNHVTKGKMYQDIVMTMGGRVAEAISFDDVCTGASGDIQQATKRARAMITQYGFSDKLGPVQYGGENNEVFLGRDYGHTHSYSEATASLIDEEVKALITKAYDECKELLRAHTEELNELAEYLIEYEKIDGDDFEKLMKGELQWRKKEEIDPEKLLESLEEISESEVFGTPENKAEAKPSDNSGNSGGASFCDMNDYLANTFKGERNTFFEIVSDEIKNDIEIISPTEERPYYIVSTTAMSSKPMTMPSDMSRANAEKLRLAEIMILLPKDWKMGEEAFKDEKWYWPVRALKTAAEYVHESKTWLGNGHDIQFSNPAKPFADNTKLSALMFMSPTEERFRGFENETGNYINIYCAVPIYKEELKEKIKDSEKGGTKLFQKIYGEDPSIDKLVVDINRKNFSK